MTFSTTEQEFISNWADRWCSLRELLYDYLDTDDTSHSPVSPSEFDQQNYNNLCSWLLNNEMSFLPLWKHFYMSRDWALNMSKELITEIRDAEDALENPFFHWYGMEDLGILFRLHIIESERSRVDEEKAWATADALLNLDKIALEFVCWVRDIDLEDIWRSVS